MLKILSLVISFFVLTSLFAQKIHYTLKMPKPQNHYFEVEMQIDGVKDKEIDLKMPVWSPGSYLVREFSKNVNLVKAYDESGKEFPVEKVSKNTWRIKKGAANHVRVNYEVYAFELSVRTSFLDLSHAFVSGPSVFMYTDALKNQVGTLEVIPFSGFKKVSTALPKQGKSGGFNYQFKNYDQLVDCPLEIGNQEVFEFTAAGVKHEVAMYGAGNYEVETLKRDMAKIVESETKVFGENPNKEYTFIIHNVVDGQGGLEHMNSTTLSVNRWTYQGSSYLGFLSLVAHEYFHLWNVKRIRPIELGPFNYDEENYTELLWVMEGFTSYYDELIPRRAGFYSAEQFVQKLSSTINYVEGSVGTRVQSVAHASFDAWVKAYRPNENSSNTTMTYYSRGAMLAALLDAQAMAKFGEKKSLDHFLQQLYHDFYKKMNRGFSNAEFKAALSKFMEEDMSGFFEDYVEGTKVPPFKKYFEPIGLEVAYTGNEKPFFGAYFKDQGGTTVVRSIQANSAAEDAGLSVNDEVIGVNGYRVSKAQLDGIINGLQANDKFKLLISRDEIIMEIEASMGVYEKPSYNFSFSENPETSKLRNYWLRVD